jgi:hypothetical protein
VLSTIDFHTAGIGMRLPYPGDERDMGQGAVGATSGWSEDR